MELFNKKYFENTPFKIEYEEIKNGPHKWSYTHIKIFKENNFIGEYTYHYNSYSSPPPFYPFQSKSGVWYCLYSNDYTATRIAKLETTFEDWCGERGKENGFCPVHFYVPKRKISESIIKLDYRGGKKVEPYYESWKTYYWDNEDDFNEEIDEGEEDKYIGEFYTEFGFIAGCFWGDDTSWKLQYLDLSQIDDKKFKRENRFGYIAMHSRAKSLKDCFKFNNFSNENGGDEIVTIILDQPFNLNKK